VKTLSDEVLKLEPVLRPDIHSKFEKGKQNYRNKAGDGNSGL
jgi:hypothetical protein